MEVLKRISRHHLAVVGLIILIPMVLCAIFAPFVAPHDPYEPDLKNVLPRRRWRILLGRIRWEGMCFPV